jgi:YCII-related domain
MSHNLNSAVAVIGIDIGKTATADDRNRKEFSAIHRLRWHFPKTSRACRFIDGPFAETKELVAGYWVLQVKSKEEAIEWIKRCPNPHEGESEIEIRQVFELEDFGASEAVEHHRRLGEQIGKK